MHFTSTDARRTTLRPLATVLRQQPLEQKERPHEDLVELLVSRDLEDKVARGGAELGPEPLQGAHKLPCKYSNT